MRRLEDANGRIWDVVVGRESWGALYAIFVPKAVSADGAEPTTSPEVRQAPLDASAYADANEELEAMTDAALRELLARSTPKTTG